MIITTYFPLTGETIDTDGCTGFPDQLGAKDLRACCGVHDDGGTDGALIDCLQALDPTSFLWCLGVLLAVVLMHIGRPIYNLAQRLGWLPKTKGTKF